LNRDSVTRCQQPHSDDLQQAELPEGGTIRVHRIDATEGEDAISAFAE